MKLPIRRKVILFVGLPTVIIYLGLMAWVLGYSKRQAILIHERDMEDQATAAAARFDDYISKAARVADTSARFVSRVPEVSSDQIYAVLRDNVSLSKRIYGAAMAFEPGSFAVEGEDLFCPYAFKGGDTAAGEELVQTMNIGRDAYDWHGTRENQSEWWHSAKDAGEGIWTEPYFDEGAGNILMITYSVPFFEAGTDGEDGEFRGVTTVDIDLDSLHNAIGNAIIGEHEFHVLARDGHFVFSTVGNQMFGASVYELIADSGDAGLEPKVRKMLDEGTGEAMMSGLFGQQRKMFAYAPIPSTDWVFVTAMDESEALVDYRKRAAYVAATFNAGLGLILLGIFFVSGKLTRPIDRLRGKVLQIAGGEVGVSLDDVETGDEIGELAGAFAVMQEKVADRERKLEHARETTLTELLESAPDAMIVADANGIICRMNARAADTFGYTRDQLQGMSVERLMPDRFRKGHGGHLLRYFADPQPRAMNQGLELYGKRADGSEFPIELGLSPFHEPDGRMAVAAVRDITLRKEQEEEISKREARFRTLVDNIPGTVYRCLHDADWTMQFISDDVESLTGFPAEELIGNKIRTFDSIITPSDRESVAEKVGEAVEGKCPWAIEYRIDRRDGETRWIGETGRAIYGEGGEVEYLDGVIADISERKEMEAQLLVAREQAEAANRAKSEFLSHMSHELRTPLNGVLGYAQILQRSPDVTEKQRGSLDAIISCGDHLLSLINDVLDLSKIEAGRIELDLAPCDLHELIEGVANILRPRAQEGGIGFKIEVGPEVPVGVVTDAAKLRQILVNLLGNAVKFTSDGDVILRIGELPDGTFRFEVLDSGVGIAADELEAIFDPFKQVEAGKAAGGTGLGLAITQRLVAKLGGALVVESEEGKGSNFYFALPLEEGETADFETMGDAAFDASSAKLAPGQKCTILIADDRETNRDILEQMLDDMGFTTVLADDGDVAIEVLRKQHFDMVLMDVRMPRMNGIDAVTIIRGDDSIKEVKVIAVTASVFPDFRKKAVIAGFDDFLGKPFRASELIGKLQQHLGVEFVSDEKKPEAEIDSGGDGAIVLPERALEDLRKALKIRNLTAINAIAARLSEDPSTTAAGEEIGRLARAFDFAGLGELADNA